MPAVEAIARSHHSAIYFRGGILVYGGTTRNNDRDAGDVRHYSINTRQWTVLSCSGNPPAARLFSAGCAVDSPHGVAERLFIFGGLNPLRRPGPLIAASSATSAYPAQRQESFDKGYSSALHVLDLRPDTPLWRVVAAEGAANAPPPLRDSTLSWFPGRSGGTLLAFGGYDLREVHALSGRFELQSLEWKGYSVDAVAAPAATQSQRRRSCSSDSDSAGAGCSGGSTGGGGGLAGIFGGVGLSRFRSSSSSSCCDGGAASPAGAAAGAAAGEPSGMDSASDLASIAAAAAAAAAAVRPPAPLPRRGHSGTVLNAQRLYIFGGCGGVCSYYDDLWVGTPKRDVAASGVSWSEVEATGVAPCARAWHSATALPARGRIIVYGGRDARGCVGDSELLWILDVGLEGAVPPQWACIPWPSAIVAAPRPRHAHSATLLDELDVLVIFGGCGEDDELLDDVSALDISHLS